MLLFLLRSTKLYDVYCVVRLLFWVLSALCTVCSLYCLLCCLFYISSYSCIVAYRSSPPVYLWLVLQLIRHSTFLFIFWMLGVIVHRLDYLDQLQLIYTDGCEMQPSPTHLPAISGLYLYYLLSISHLPALYSPDTSATPPPAVSCPINYSPHPPTQPPSTGLDASTTRRPTITASLALTPNPAPYT